MCQLSLIYFLAGSLTQNVFSGRFSNVNDKFNVTNVTNKTFSSIFHK